MRSLWAFVFTVLGLSSALLASWKWGRNLGHSAGKQGPKLTCRRLLLVELLLFGGTALYFAASIHVVAAGRIAPNWVVYNMMSSITWSCVLAFTYTMIAANARPRAIGMVTLLLAVPISVVVYEWFASARFAEVVNSGMVSMIVLTGIVCWGALFYWVFRLNRLNHEAARARRFGQYRLKQLIGRGGMGEVYLAEHTLLKRPCALKRIRPGHDTDPTTLARFEREVRATAELSHPHTVEIYDYGRAGDGTFYYVMELLWGLTLDDLVQKQGPLPAARAVYLLRQVCERAQRGTRRRLDASRYQAQQHLRGASRRRIRFRQAARFRAGQGDCEDRSTGPLARRNGGRLAALYGAGTISQRGVVGCPRGYLRVRGRRLLSRGRTSAVRRGQSRSRS